nr:1-phosphatidylinositol-3-phosphate 5-kinase FAB1B-like [Tanacetum cinerariifolium]
MYFEGCPKPLGCTILLRGANGDELKKVKHVIQYGVFAAYHLALKTSFLADEGTSLPDLPLNSPLTVALPDKASINDRSISTIPGFTLPLNQNGTEQQPPMSGCVPMSEVFSSIINQKTDAMLPAGSMLPNLVVPDATSGGLPIDAPTETKNYRFPSCEMPSDAHVQCYTHREGTLTIYVKKLTDALPGENDGKIWMWHRCLKCPRVDGSPPAICRIVMSDFAWGLSFGKFLDLSFSSNHAAASRAANCGHNLHRDCFGKWLHASDMHRSMYTQFTFLHLNLFSIMKIRNGYKMKLMRVEFADDGPLGKVRYSVTCYYAKRFEALRRICCPSELDFIRSLSRCKKWGAQGGKSNVFFAKTLDDRFIIKQVTKTELESFIKFAPAYFKYLSES